MGVVPGLCKGALKGEIKLWAPGLCDDLARVIG